MSSSTPSARLGIRRTLSLYRSFGPFLSAYRGKMATAYAALGASVAMTLLRPWPVKLVLDVVLLQNQTLSDALPVLPGIFDAWSRSTLLAVLACSVIAIVLLESLFGYAQKVLFSEAGQSSTTDVLEHVFTHLQTLPRSDSRQTRTGDVILRLTSDIKTLRDLLVNHQQKFARYAVTFLSTVLVMAWMNWPLTLLALGVVPAVYVASYRFAGKIRRVATRKRTREGALASVVQETLGAMPVVQAFTQEKEERSRFRREARQSLDAGLESSRLGGAFTRSIKVLNSVGTAIVLWFGGTRVLEGSLSPGDLVVFVAYVNELYVPIQSLSELAVQFIDSLVSGERVHDLLKVAPRIKDRPHAVKVRRLIGEVVFENVVFGYDDGPPILDDISFRVEPGQMVALVGASGAGKSTIGSLLLRFIDPLEGRIRFDGRDARDYALRSLRRQISVVLQESILFRRTVRENIAYGQPGAAFHQVVAAAKAARAHDFIESLPQGYETMLDERGGNLSGGQRQRITLARAFLRDTPILLLDEPTTGLDAATESELLETLLELARGRTTFVIAHAMASFKGADLILMLEKGRIVERGTPPDLLAARGSYWKLFNPHAPIADY